MALMEKFKKIALKKPEEEKTETKKEESSHSTSPERLKRDKRQKLYR